MIKISFYIRLLAYDNILLIVYTVNGFKVSKVFFMIGLHWIGFKILLIEKSGLL